MRVFFVVLLASTPAWAQKYAGLDSGPFRERGPQFGSHSDSGAGSPGAPPPNGFGGGFFGGPPGNGGFGGGAPGPAGFPGKPFPGARIMDLGTLPGAINAGPHPSKASVVELLDDHGAWLSRQLHAPSGAEASSRAGIWHNDRFSGTSALKVAGYQRYHEKVPGWLYHITESPKEGEYRYLRFAWKKPTGRGVMLQLNASGIEWARYYAGQNIVGFAPALLVQKELPTDWTVVTRDLWADYSAKFTLTGIAFTSMEEAAYFDHIYLGRTIEDLDRVTKAHQQRSTKPLPLGGVQFQTYWQNLGHPDAAVRLPATWAIARSADASVPLIAEALQLPDPGATERRIQQAIIDLDAPRYVVRERASKELAEHGRSSVPYLETALTNTKDNLELQTRLTKLSASIQQRPIVDTDEQRRWLQVVRILEHADAKSAQPLLTKLAEAKLPAGLSAEAQAVLARRVKPMP